MFCQNAYRRFAKTPMCILLFFNAYRRFVKMHIGVLPKSLCVLFNVNNTYWRLTKCLYALFNVKIHMGVLQNAYMRYFNVFCTGVFPKRRSAPSFPINSSSLLQLCRSFSPVFLLICLSPSMLLLFLILWFLVTFLL